MFQQRIQLQREEPRSRWSIPCCSSFRTRGIQLPEDDSDHEEEEEQNIAPFHIESTHFLQHPANLSRNPFARVDEQPEPPKIVLPSQEEQLIEVTEQESSRQKYENEPDWTELHQAASAAADAASDDDDDDKSDEQSLQEETIVTVTEEEIPKKQEKIPQIEREVLHLLPLPQLSNELPPTMIHKKPSFEKSMYGEQPLMSTTSRSNNTSRFSRFSMTEQDFLALKKQETDAATATATATVSAAVTATATATASAASTVTTPISIETPTETPIMTDPLQATHVRKSSIVSNAAQSILGDKLDDFTEKLAFIKKNIIMNQDSDDEEADNAEETLRKIALLKQDPSTTTVSSDMAGPGTRTLHRRTSSLMDVAPTLARFMNQISEDFSALAGPESQRTAVTEEEDDDGEELFDFTKVIEIGKNMRSFSEGFVGNGIRILNDVATRIKTNTDEDNQEEDLKEENEEGNWINDSYI